MRLNELLECLSETISGTRCKESVARIDRFHRIQASPGYDEAMESLCAALREAGIAHEVHEYPADASSKTYEWVCPPAWTIWSATLRQVSPSDRLLGRFDEIPQLVVVHSPAGVVEGEVVHVDRGTDDDDFEGAEVRGKILLASGRASEVLKQARKRGAAGVVVYPDSARAAASYDLVQYQGIFPPAEEIPGLVPAFSISRRMADGFLRTLRHESVVLRGEVDAEYTENRLRVLEAWVDGADSQAGETLLSAHLCHPRNSANDNASGSAVLLELALAFRDLCSRERMSGGVRFLWVPEFYGTLPWAASHADELQRVQCVINLDMVGQSPERIGEPLRIFRSPNHVPHFTNALIEPLAERVAALEGAVSPNGSKRTLHWVFDRPSGGSDHLVFAAAPHDLPAFMLGHDDPYWHTSHDTIENVDPTRLKHVALLAGALAAAPFASEEDHPLLVEWVTVYAVRELSHASALARTLDGGTGRAAVAMALEIETERVRSLKDSGVADTLLEPVLHLLEQLALQYIHLLPAHESEEAVRGPRPLRAIDGPLVYAVTDRLNEEETAFFKEKLSDNHRAMAEGVLNLCDGTRTVEDIAMRLSLDFDRGVAAEDVERAVSLLAKVGYVVAQDEEGNGQ